MNQNRQKDPGPDIPHWMSPLKGLSVCADEIHVWRCFLDRPEHQKKMLVATLSDDESRRAAHFHFERDRLRFLITRGMLRTILGRYLGTEPREVCFTYGIIGKPSLAESQGPRLCFNISYSRDLALFAFAYDRKTGVDVEYIDHDREIAHIVERFFSSEEISEFYSLPQDKRHEAFFTYWTCKEAYLTAEGMGLSFGLDKVALTMTQEGSVSLTAIDGDVRKAASWTLRILDPAPGYAAALAVNGHGLGLRKWDWDLTLP